MSYLLCCMHVICIQLYSPTWSQVVGVVIHNEAMHVFHHNTSYGISKLHRIHTCTKFTSMQDAHTHIHNTHVHADKHLLIHHCMHTHTHPPLYAHTHIHAGKHTHSICTRPHPCRQTLTLYMHTSTSMQANTHTLYAHTHIHAGKRTHSSTTIMHTHSTLNVFIDLVILSRAYGT